MTIHPISQTIMSLHVTTGLTTVFDGYFPCLQLLHMIFQSLPLPEVHMFEDSETVHLQASRCPSNNEPVSKNHYREIVYVT